MNLSYAIPDTLITYLFLNKQKSLTHRYETPATQSTITKFNLTQEIGVNICFLYHLLWGTPQ